MVCKIKDKIVNLQQVNAKMFVDGLNCLHCVILFVPNFIYIIFVPLHISIS
jgi:hypothetical protein